MSSDRISPPSALLLLPPPPAISFDQFRAVYEPVLSAVFANLLKAINGSNKIASLDIALSLPGLQSPSCQPPTKAFASLQRIVEHMYRLIGIICLERKIEMEAPGGIDARVILLDFDSIKTTTAGSGSVKRNGPIVDVKTLASSGRLWDSIFYPHTPVGQDLEKGFSSFYASTKDPNGGVPQPVQGVPQWIPGQTLVIPDEASEASLHHSVILGGTFDHFHIGHKLLLTATALVLQPAETVGPEKERTITVGVTGDDMLKNKKFAQFLESWDERCRSTIAFLTAIMDFCPPEAEPSHIKQIYNPGPNGRAMILKIRPGISLKMAQILDPYGPTITEEDLSALVVSKETRSGGAAVNQERAKRNWKQLEVFEVDVIHSGEVPSEDVESFESKISSTDIRRRRMELAMIYLSETAGQGDDIDSQQYLQAASWGKPLEVKPLKFYLGRVWGGALQPFSSIRPPSPTQLGHLPQPECYGQGGFDPILHELAAVIPVSVPQQVARCQGLVMECPSTQTEGVRPR
ncbi:hypothetical protein BDV18DRAFT_162041 [Aspergillus unguis]